MVENINPTIKEYFTNGGINGIATRNSIIYARSIVLDIKLFPINITLISLNCLCGNINRDFTIDILKCLFVYARWYSGFDMHFL